MRKIFLFSALIVSAIGYAQSSVKWYDLVEPVNSIAQGTTAYENVQTNGAGDIFLYGNIGSVGMDPHAVVMGDTVATVAFKENMSQTNTAPFFVKVNSEGNVQWTVVCNDGRFTSYAGLALEDGGMLVAATAYQSQASVLSFASHYTPAQTAKYEQSKEQYGVLLKIAADGKPTILSKFEQAEAGKTDGIAFRDIVTDGTDYFVLANVKSAVKIAGETDTIAPTAAGACLAVLKFNAAGVYQRALMTDGVAMTSTTAKLTYANNTLYITSPLEGTNGSSLSLGSASAVVPNNLKNFAVLEASLGLAGQRVMIVEGAKVKVSGKDKNAITTYGVQVKGSNLYVSGFFQGGIVYGSDTLKNETANNKAFVSRINLTSGTCDKAILMGEGAALSSFNVDGLLQHGDSLYAYYYDWAATGDRVFLQALDDNLVLGSRLGLINTTTMGTTRGAAFAGNDLVYTYYAPKGISKLSVDATISVNPKGFRGMVVAQTVFSSLSPIQEVRADDAANGAKKAIQNGNVYILDKGSVYTVNGQKVQ